MTGLEITVVAGTSLLGIVAGVVGTFAVLRRRALVGDLISHAALPGLCLAFLIMGGRHFGGMLAGAFVTGLAGVALIAFICRWTRTKEDAAIGIVLSTFFGAGIVLKSMIQRITTGGSPAGLDSYIYGQAALLRRGDVWAIAAVSAAGILIVLLLYKEFKVFSFDPEFAQAQGWPTVRLDLLMMGTLALVTAVGLPAVGVVLMAAMLITPAAAARFWTDRLSRTLILSGAFGGTAGLAGSLISAGVFERWFGFDPFAFGYNQRGLPAGPVIVLCGTAVFLFSMLFAPRRGIVGRLFAHLRLRAKTARENLLRTLYELNEPQLPGRAEIPIGSLLMERSWSRATVRNLLRLASRFGWVETNRGYVRLTETGLARAAEITRRHRLWELYLIQGANVAADHVDRDADNLEHLLGPQLMDRLEADLVATGHMPGQLPGSPHELSASSTKSTTEGEQPRTMNSAF